LLQLGEHVLGCGDSRDKTFVARLIGDRKVKAVISDPPFGVSVTESKKDSKRFSK